MRKRVRKQARPEGACPEKKKCEHLKRLRAELLKARREMRLYRDQFAEERARRTRTEEQLLTDPLTGAYNRRGLEMKFPEECSRVARFRSKKLFLIFLDIDKFKRFNDEHGEQTGDRVLQEVVRTIEGTMRKHDSLYRIGGEEFVVVVLEVKTLKAACKITERIRLRVEKLKVKPHDGGDPLSVTISLGIAKLGSGDSLDTLIDKANQAEQEAKKQGRNRSYVYLGGEVLPAVNVI
jgi:diguanylate cyclase (GGDEF)-like protein